MRFFTEIFTLFAILASYTVCAAPTQAGVVRRLTNAERFARGLGPAPPVFKRVLPGVETPTRAYEVEKRAKPSGTPPVKYVKVSDHVECLLTCSIDRDFLPVTATLAGFKSGIKMARLLDML